MTPPDRENLKATPAYVRELLERVGMPQIWVANRIGIAHRRLQYLVKGERVSKGVTEPVLLSYPEQYTLECLAESVNKDQAGSKTCLLYTSDAADD